MKNSNKKEWTTQDNPEFCKLYLNTFQLVNFYMLITHEITLFQMKFFCHRNDINDKSYAFTQFHSH